MVSVKPVIRRSHTKSKIGCKTCKSRHIKCDEFQPQCRNCLLTKRLCTYPASSTGEPVNHPVSGLSWPTDIEQSCQKWRDIGEPPFPILNLPKTPSWHSLSMRDLRYMHQLALLASILELGKTRQMCLWWCEFPLFFQIATKYDFVAHAHMANSAERLALVTRSVEALEDSARYKSLALNGLHKAIHSFSKKNADAVLCASICLGYHPSNWRGLMAIMHGISTITRQMSPWARESGFSSYLDQRSLDNQSEEHSPSQNEADPTQAVGYRNTLLEQLLPQGIKSLNQLASSTQNDTNMSAMIRQLRDILRLVYERHSSGWSVAEQYQLIYPFSTWMTKYSISFISISEGDTFVLTTLAHFFAVVVTLAIAFPATDIPVFVSIRIKGIIEAGQILGGRSGIFCDICGTFHYQNEMMDYPLNTVHAHRKLWGNKSDIATTHQDSTDV